MVVTLRKGTPYPVSKFMINSSELQDNSGDTSLNIMKISSKDPLRGFETNIYDGFDWALIELDDVMFHCVNEVILPEGTKGHTRHLFLKDKSNSPPLGEVIAITRRGIVKGFAAGSACSI